ncbi:MAG: hypothetical protein OXH52_16720 [Gammaproteobacteria bacterium]|nr:hypothetical protein [Gammaproteobacteria bacterium]
MDFKDYAAQEKNRLIAERDVIERKLQALDNAIRAYEGSVGPAGAAPRSAPAKKRRRRRSPPRAEVARIIGASGNDGIGRAGVILALKVKGNKSAEQSVSNTLAALKKAGEVRHEDGKYFGS